MQKDTLRDKIAIILPVFNASKYLESCLQSILSQTFTNFIIFAINDGSTDESGNILDKYASLDPRIKVLHKKMKVLVPLEITHWISLRKMTLLTTSPLLIVMMFCLRIF